jgi:hypothetical protein
VPPTPVLVHVPLLHTLLWHWSFVVHEVPGSPPSGLTTPVLQVPFTQEPFAQSLFVEQPPPGLLTQLPFTHEAVAPHSALVVQLSPGLVEQVPLVHERLAQSRS